MRPIDPLQHLPRRLSLLVLRKSCTLHSPHCADGEEPARHFATRIYLPLFRETKEWDAGFDDRGGKALRGVFERFDFGGVVCIILLRGGDQLDDLNHGLPEDDLACGVKVEFIGQPGIGVLERWRAQEWW